MRCHRIGLGLTQRQLATELGVDPWTVLNWENGRTKPTIESMGAILRWLGYDPQPRPKTLQERMYALRIAFGWTASRAASELGVDPGTWSRWERTGIVRQVRLKRELLEFLERRFRCLEEEQT